jgi:hypothetical protein
MGRKSVSFRLGSEQWIKKTAATLKRNKILLFKIKVLLGCPYVH